MKITRKKLKAEVPSTAMGDIAFNLLVFFVILAKAQDDSHVQWVPATAPKVVAAGAATVRVAIDKENKLFLNGQQVGLQQLGPALESQLSKRGTGERTVLFKCHREASAQTFEPVIEAIGNAGGDLVHILDEKKEPR